MFWNLAAPEGTEGVAWGNPHQRYRSKSSARADLLWSAAIERGSSCLLEFLPGQYLRISPASPVPEARGSGIKLKVYKPSIHKGGGMAKFSVYSVPVETSR